MGFFLHPADKLPPEGTPINILITGAAGNLGSHLARRLLPGRHELRLLIHRKDLPYDISGFPNAEALRADLGDPATLAPACRGVDGIIHFAGILFAPGPEAFLPRTNVSYVDNLVAAALSAGVRKFILVSFPHVVGESFPDRPARETLEGNPESAHARTRLLAERHLFEACQGTGMTPVSLRPGMIYARGVLMIDAARALMHRRFLGVWREPTWIHLLSLTDFLSAAIAAIEGEAVRGIYNLGDDRPLTLQEFFDALALRWRLAPPWRGPRWTFLLAGLLCEGFAALFGTPSPLTRDFIRIGMVSYVADTARMKRELLPALAYPTLQEGLVLL